MVKKGSKYLYWIYYSFVICNQEVLQQWHVGGIYQDLIVFGLRCCFPNVIFSVTMDEVEAQQTFDNFFEEVFTELEDKVGLIQRWMDLKLSHKACFSNQDMWTLVLERIHAKSFFILQTN